MVRPHNPIAVASNPRRGEKGEKMPPLTGLARRWLAVSTRMPRRRCSRCPGWLERPQGESRRAMARPISGLRRNCCSAPLQAAALRKLTEGASPRGEPSLPCFTA